MIRQSIGKIKKATFLVRVPSTVPEHKGFPFPNGTGFFISDEGYFVTANHVIASIDSSENLMIEQPELPVSGGSQLKHINIVKTWHQFDIALLKVDFQKNREKSLLRDKKGFDYIEIDFEDKSDGTPIYSYGFPLPKVEIKGGKGIMIGLEYLCPRVTSAIISSHYDAIGPVRSAGLPKWYVIDKALNYGNSGGPILCSETGKAIAVCARFQPVLIPQQQNIRISVPSLYSIASSLANIESELKKLI